MNIYREKLRSHESTSKSHELILDTYQNFLLYFQMANKINFFCGLCDGTEFGNLLQLIRVRDRFVVMWFDLWKRTKEREESSSSCEKRTVG